MTTQPNPETNPENDFRSGPSVTPGPQGYSSAPPPPQGQPDQYQNQCAQGPYGRQVLPEHPNAMMVLLLAIVGIFIPLVSFVGWYVGSSAKKEAAAQGYDTGGSLQIGWVISVAVSVIQIFSVLMIFFGVVLFLGLLTF